MNLDPLISHAPIFHQLANQTVSNGASIWFSEFPIQRRNLFAQRNGFSIYLGFIINNFHSAHCLCTIVRPGCHMCRSCPHSCKDAAFADFYNIRIAALPNQFFANYIAPWICVSLHLHSVSRIKTIYPLSHIDPADILFSALFCLRFYGNYVGGSSCLIFSRCRAVSPYFVTVHLIRIQSPVDPSFLFRGKFFYLNIFFTAFFISIDKVALCFFYLFPGKLHRMGVFRNCFYLPRRLQSGSCRITYVSLSANQRSCRRRDQKDQYKCQTAHICLLFHNTSPSRLPFYTLWKREGSVSFFPCGFTICPNFEVITFPGF